MGTGIACTHPTIILLCVHKGASTFLANDLAPALTKVLRGMKHVEMGQEVVNGRTVEDFPLPPTGVVMSRVYPFLYDEIVEDPVPAAGRFADKKLVMLRRDPRDVAVSLYYSIRYSHTSKTRNPEAFLRKRERLEALDICQGIAEETAPTAMKQFKSTFKFMRQHPDACLTTYEQLILDFDGWFDRVSSYLELTNEETEKIRARIAPTVEPPQKENPRKHKRRVTPGNWREIFDDDLRALFEERVGRQLEKANYSW